MSEDAIEPGRGIAVVGMQVRFPGAADVEAFWSNLCAGVESITRLSDEELRAAGVDERTLADPDYVRATGLVEGIDQFDAGFFEINPAEAELLDPQHRVFLEVCWEALEASGHSRAGDAAVGVFAGAGMNTYALNQVFDRRATVHVTDLYRAMLANDKDFLATRVSYELDLRGPSVSVQSACSTSLVAVHLACQSLMSGECDVALAGGVSIVVPQKVGYRYQPGMILSPDGHCRAFDSAAAGIVGGNGAGVVVLRRLEDALADGDEIHAVILASAINNDGGERLGFTTPSLAGQTAVIGEALALAEVEAETIGYVEAHGTGTAIGDAIEIAGLREAFASERRGFCGLGSVKTNVGHLNTAAGVAGLIKAVLALRHRKLPPSLHFERANPELGLDDSPFYVVDRLRDWDEPDHPRRAGVSAFGIGGTNVHVILEEPPDLAGAEHEARARELGHALLVLSARTPSALTTMAGRLGDWIARHPEAGLGEVARTLATTRVRFEERGFLVVREHEDAAAVLRGAASSPRFVRVRTPARDDEREVAWLFSEQGAQHVAMGRELRRRSPVYAAALDEACAVLKRECGVDLEPVLDPEGSPFDDELEATLRRTELAQPALFAVAHALAQVWRDFGVRPRALLGHSVGEYVAACAAGVFERDDALRLIAARGRIMRRMPPGSMLSVSLPEAEVAALLDDRLALAAVNGPAQCVVSGDADRVAAVREELEGRGVSTIPLRTSHAFHSHLCEPLLAEFRACVARTKRRPPSVPVISNLTGTWLTAAEATSTDYWVEHMRRTVRFDAGLSTLLRAGARVVIEVGPGRSLAELARRHADAPAELVACASLPPRRERGNDVEALLTALGSVWAAGVEIEWDRVFGQAPPRRPALPTYPFERRRYWARRSSPAAREVAASSSAGRAELDGWCHARTWRRELAAAPEVAGPGRRWLVLGRGEALTRLAAALERRGHEVVRVEAGAGWAESGERSYAIDPEAAADHERLFARLAAHELEPDRVVMLAGVAEDPFVSALALARQLAGTWADAELGARELVIVSEAAHMVTGLESLRPRQATARGIALVVGQEHPQIACRTIDVEGEAPIDRRIERLVATLERDGDPPLVALRGPWRWLPTIEPLGPSELSRSSSAAAGRLRDGGVYLITGGLGGLGLAFAEGLARTLARPGLILVGRSASPDSPGASAAVERLSALGAEVAIMAADVSEPAAVEAMLAEVRARFGRSITGVIHAAGLVSTTPLASLTPTAAAAEMAAKLRGAENLDRALAAEPPEFMVLCSSLAGTLGGLGLAAYVGANAFLDAFAAWRSAARPGLSVAIAWDGWHELGMAAPERMSAGDRERHQAARLASGAGRGITASEGFEVLARILGGELEQVLVSTSDLAARLGRGQAGETDPTVGQGGEPGPHPRDQSGPRPRHPRPDLVNAYVAPGDELERLIAGVWMEILGIERVGVNDNFFELGADSFLMVAAHGALRERLRGIEGASPPSVADLFAHPNVRELAGRIRPISAAPSVREHANNRAELQRRALDFGRRRQR